MEQKCSSNFMLCIWPYSSFAPDRFHTIFSQCMYRLRTTTVQIILISSSNIHSGNKTNNCCNRINCSIDIQLRLANEVNQVSFFAKEEEEEENNNIDINHTIQIECIHKNTGTADSNRQTQREMNLTQNERKKRMFAFFQIENITLHIQEKKNYSKKGSIDILYNITHKEMIWICCC